MGDLRPESTWTAPRPDCPHPERWHATDDQSAEVEVAELVAGFVRALQPDHVVETGTAYGSTALWIADALKANRRGHLWTLEPDPDRADAARHTLRHARSWVTVVEQPSLEWQPVDDIGFAWLDSDQHVRVDEVEWLRPHVAPGAVFGIHDTGPHHTVHRYLPDLTDVVLLRLPTPRGVVFGQWT